jgi:hypothetical protein
MNSVSFLYLTRKNGVMRQCKNHLILRLSSDLIKTDSKLLTRQHESVFIIFLKIKLINKDINRVLWVSSVINR